MKILHILPAFYPRVGGIQSFALSLLQELQERGHTNCVITSHGLQPVPDEIAVGEIPVHRVPLMTGLTGRDPVQLLRAKTQTAHIKRNFAPDVVHLHIGGPISFLYLATENVAPAPLVVTIYDLPEPGKDAPSLQKVLEKASAVAAISTIRLEECRAFAPQAARRMTLIYAGKPGTATIRQIAPTPLILMVGRMVPEKGFDLAIEAFAKIIHAFPASRLVLVGDGPIRAELTTQVERLGLQNSIRLTGRLDNEALAALYSQAWMTLVPSRHSESFGLVALEAMQAACPVIASRVGGLQEVVVAGETGLLIPKDDVQALTEAMTHLLEDPVGAQLLGQAGRQRAQAVFDWNTCVSAYETLYREAGGR